MSEQEPWRDTLSPARLEEMRRRTEETRNSDYIYDVTDLLAENARLHAMLAAAARRELRAGQVLRVVSTLPQIPTGIEDELVAAQVRGLRLFYEGSLMAVVAMANDFLNATADGNEVSES